MNCPDCKYVEMDYVKFGVDSNGNDYRLDDPFWKCPKCKIEVEDEREDL